MTVEEHQSAIPQATLSTDESSSEVGSILKTYRPTAYEPVTWPVVSSEARKDSFSVSNYERVSERQYAVDPMFANFDREVELMSELHKEGKLAPHSFTTAQKLDRTKTHDSLFNDAASSESSSLEVQMGEFSGALPEIQGPEGDSFEDSGNMSDDGPEISEPSQGAPRLHKETSVAPHGSADLDEVVEREVLKRLAAAQEEREQMLAQVQQAAYSKALEEARAEFEDLKKQYSIRFETIVDDTRSQVDETCRGNEQRAVELAFQIAKKLLGAVVTDHHEYIHEVISEALRAAGNAEIQSVRVSPQDYEFLSMPQGSDASSAMGRAWKLESDDSIGAGCIVVTSAGDVDFDLEKSWARMREKVTRGPKS